MDWLLLALIAPMMWALNNIIDKFILTKKLRDPYTFNILTMLYDLIPLLLILAIVPINSASPWNIFSIVTGLLIVPIMLLYNKSMMFEEASRVGSLTYTYAIFVAVLAFVFLHETFGPLKYVGTFSLVLGAALISLKRTKKSRKIIISPALVLIVAYAFLWGVNSIISKYTLDNFDLWSFYVWSLFGSFVGGILMLAQARTRKNFLSDMKKISRSTLFYIFLTSSVFYVGDFAFVAALSSGFASLVSAVSATQPLFIVIFASLVSVFEPRILKEEIGRSAVAQKILAAVLILVGTYLVAIA